MPCRGSDALLTAVRVDPESCEGWAGVFTGPEADVTSERTSDAPTPKHDALPMVTTSVSSALACPQFLERVELANNTDRSSPLLVGTAAWCLPGQFASSFLARTYRDR
jgi:hypothetical protein